MKDRCVVVTGGEGGLGRAIAAEFSAAGYRVEAPGRDKLDVTQPDSIAAFFEGLGTTPSVLINNAGVAVDRLFPRMSENDWNEVIDVNLKGAFLCSREALRRFSREGGAHIMNIGSFSSEHPPAGQANYAAAKAGLLGLTRSLAREYGKRSIRVNAVLPGFLVTRMTEGMSEKRIDEVRRRHSLGRFNTVEDTARFLVFLDGMSHVSGQVFQLDSRV